MMQSLQLFQAVGLPNVIPDFPQTLVISAQVIRILCKKGSSLQNYQLQLNLQY